MSRVSRPTNCLGESGRKIGQGRRRYLQGALGLLLLALACWSAGCATMRGLGEDIQSLGRGIQKVFTR
ncbi:MAG TPA: entericidin A/B family lipoprotein [Candidatus Methylomirabilis sp.]|nr:entericidin A/B family lipoprotein [Candidatus Methylomirabilis sp.]HSC72415.1 entericidin A/B family lipoprotein [Candidatus Methylomirabilis sp.]